MAYLEERMNEMLCRAIAKDPAAANDLLEQITQKIEGIAKAAAAIKAVLEALQCSYELEIKEKPGESRN